MVSGGHRHGGSVDIGHYFCVGARHGEWHRHDVSADVLGLHRGICGYSLCAVASLLPAEPDDHLQLLGTAHRTEGLQDGGGVLPVVEDDGGGGALLCGLLDTDGVWTGRRGWHWWRTRRLALCRCRRCNDSADMAVHATGRHQNAGVDGCVADHLSVQRLTPYYI